MFFLKKKKKKRSKVNKNKAECVLDTLAVSPLTFQGTQVQGKMLYRTSAWLTLLHSSLLDSANNNIVMKILLALSLFNGYGIN